MSSTLLESSRCCDTGGIVTGHACKVDIICTVFCNPPLLRSTISAIKRSPNFLVVLIIFDHESLDIRTGAHHISIRCCNTGRVYSRQP